MVRRLQILLLFPAFLSGAGCSPGGSGPDPQDTITREAFVDAYFALRAAALRLPHQEITPQERDRVLRELGVTQEDLYAFVEVWGEDATFMEGIWNEIEDRMMRTRSEPSFGNRGPGGGRDPGVPDDPPDPDDPPARRPQGGPGRGGPGE